MKILHIVYDFTPGRFPGGIPKIVHELAIAQYHLGHEVAIFSPQMLSGQVRQHNKITLNDYPLMVHTPASLRKCTTIRSISQLVGDYDVLHSHNTFLPLNFYTALWSQLRGVPSFFHVHGALDPIVVNRGLTKSLKKRLYISSVERWNLNSAQVVFAVTEAEREQIRGWGIRSKIEVVPHGIDPFVPPDKKMIKEFLSKHSKLLSKNIILYLGRINEKKGVDLLLRAFAKVLPEHPSTLLVIAGNREAYPDYVSKLDGLIVNMDLSERVYWTGFLEENDKRCLFALAHLFSHVTRSEGMAVAVLEAMAAGLPVIVSPGCYMGRAVAEGAVVLSEYEENSLAVSLAKLLANHAYCEQLGESARQFTYQYHDWRKNAAQIVNTYEDSVNYEQIS